MAPHRELALRVQSLSPGYADVPIAAALASLDEDESLVLVLGSVDVVAPAHATHFESRLPELCRTPPRAGVELVGRQEGDARSFPKTVVVDSDPVSALRAVMAVLGFVKERPTRPDSDAPDAHAIRDALIADRRARAEPSSQTPVLAVVAQVQSTWPAFEPVYRELTQRGGIRLVVVQVPSDHENAELTTRNFFERYGAEVREVAWLQAQLDDIDSPLAGVVFYDPWDNFRPSPARALDVANNGVPVFYFPYANSLGVGEGAQQLAYNLPVHQVASSIFVVNSVQKRMFATYCRAGSDSVEVTGSPKMDRLLPLRSENFHRRAQVFLWNPHFHVGDKGWSTILDYTEPLLTYFAEHPELRLIVRPHFRIARDFPLIGGVYAKCWESIEATTLNNVRVDMSADYIHVFQESDALLSDYSSLITEYLQTDKPILRLGHGRAIQLNEDAVFLDEIESADDWTGVASFIESCKIDVSPHSSRVKEVRMKYFRSQDGKSAKRAADVILEKICGRSPAPMNS